MKLNLPVEVSLLVYVAVVLLLFVGGATIVARRQKTKWPFKPGDRLLRSPGESLKRQIARNNERAIFELFGSVLLACTSTALALLIISRFKLGPHLALAAVAGTLTASAIASAWWLIRQTRRQSNLLLGWFGERMTAEFLRPLEREGYYVFHDVPGEPGKRTFNLDHVAVGPTGVTVVETKTRRKLKAEAGHEVRYDGEKLIWPWGEDRHGLRQVAANADWLARWIERRTALKVAVRQVLSLPGWYVRESPGHPVRVVNPSYLANAIRGRHESVLTPEQAKLIALQLDLICRDVED